MSNGFLNESNGTYSAYLSKVDQEFRVMFSEGLLKKSVKGIDLFCVATKATGLLVKIDNKWTDLPKEAYPIKLVVNFNSENKDKEKMSYTGALLKYCEWNALDIEKGISIKGTLSVSNDSPSITEYLDIAVSSIDAETNLRIGIQHFDIRAFDGTPTLTSIPASAMSGNRGGGAPAQKVSDRIDERLAYFKSLSDIANSARLVEAFVNCNSVASMLDAKALTFAEFIAIIAE
jgi:hypothetical protein